MRKLLLTTLFLAFGAHEAAAAAWEAKTGREPLAAREVERPLVLQKNWLEFGLAVDWKNATGYWDADGEAVDFENARWTYTTERLDIRYGITRRSELYWRMPVHYVRLQNEALGTDTSDFGLGDPILAYRYEVFRNPAPVTSVILDAFIKVPAGNESPGQYIGGPYAVSRFVLSTGTPDYSLAVRAKKQFGPAAVLGSVGYTARLSSTVQYLVEVTNYQFSGRIKPGDVVFGELGLMLQAGPVALSGGVVARHRNETRMGTTGTGFNGNGQLQPVAGSDGVSVDAGGTAMLNVSRGVDVALGVQAPLAGEDLQFFPLEEIHPTRGLTMTGSLELRY